MMQSSQFAMSQEVGQVISGGLNNAGIWTVRLSDKIAIGTKIYPGTPVMFASAGNSPGNNDNTVCTVEPQSANADKVLGVVLLDSIDRYYNPGDRIRIAILYSNVVVMMRAQTAISPGKRVSFYVDSTEEEPKVTTLATGGSVVGVSIEGASADGLFRMAVNPGIWRIA